MLCLLRSYANKVAASEDVRRVKGWFIGSIFSSLNDDFMAQTMRNTDEDVSIFN